MKTSIKYWAGLAIISSVIATTGFVTMKPIQNSLNISTANNQFGFRLLNQMTRSQEKRNTIISPISIHECLSLAYLGAQGKTRTAMSNVLNLNNAANSAAGKGSQELRNDLLNADPSVEINIANAIWVRNNIQLNPSFVKDGGIYFDAKTSSLDFNSPTAAGHINGWVSDKTKGKITELIAQSDLKDSASVLTNAVYFHGKWQHPFNKNATTEMPFYVKPEVTEQIPMMAQQVTIPYYETSLYQAAALPYGNGHYQMIVILPKNSADLMKSVNDTSENWSSFADNLKPKLVDFKMPRYKSHMRYELNNPLKQMGMEVAFNKAADFSAMGSYQGPISKVVHETVVEVDEEGTVAAAATGVIHRLALARPITEPVKMIVDHPFYFAIRDTQTNTILFNGVVYKP